MSTDGTLFESNRKTAILCNTKSSAAPNRPELIDAFLKKNIQVFFGAVYDGLIHPDFSAQKNLKYLPVCATRNNTNPLTEIKSCFDTRRKIKENHIDSAIVYGVKNHPAMVIGAKLGGAKRIISVVNGKGNLFLIKGLKGTILRAAAFPMLKIAYSCSSYVCFQNRDDAALFLSKHLLNSKKVMYTNGSGVNTGEFPFTGMPAEDRFLYLSRITPSKGVTEFIEAARIVKGKFPNAIFDVVGPIDSLIEGFSSEALEAADKEKIITYHGPTNDVAAWMQKCRYFIYPSYYPEGVPRCVLQALSTGRPVITCDSSGCRATVVDGTNGYLVAPRDVKALAQRMEWLITHKAEAEKMGASSRRMAEASFDVNDINDILISAVYPD